MNTQLDSGPTEGDLARIYGKPLEPRASDPQPPAASPPSDYSIAAVSKLTGTSCHTLRVWERRYGFPVPERSPSGHRRYDRDQVWILCRLTRLARERGKHIGGLVSDLKEGRLNLGPPFSPTLELPQENTQGLTRLLLAGDAEAADREFARLAESLEPCELVERVIHPVLVEAGEEWFRRNYSVFEERLVTVFLRRKLAELIEVALLQNPHPTRSVVAATMQGDRHEGGLLMFHHAMELRGWRVHNLGVDLPARELRAAITKLHPSAMALSFVLSRNIKKRFQELHGIDTIPIFVGGRSIINYQSLARLHGLIPLPGPIGPAADRFQVEFDHWLQAHTNRV